MTAPMTLFNRLWSAHEVLTRDDGMSLLWVDRHFVHEGSHHAFRKLADRDAKVAHPELTYGVVDHYAPTHSRSASVDQAIDQMIKTLGDNCAEHEITCFDLNDPRQGIVHVIGPEQGLTLPGLLVNCGDSHTSTHGAFGSLAFGIGATEVAHVLATQTVWQQRPKTMRIQIDGTLAPGVSAKDIALGWISRLGTDGARGHAVEYTGAVVDALSMEGRMTLCNLSVEGGSRFGMIAPDEATLAYIKGRPFAPKGAAWDQAVSFWSTLRSDPDAAFDRQVVLDGSEVAPIVTWGTSPEEAAPITSALPNPDKVDHAKAEVWRKSLEYMGLMPGQLLQGTPVDQVFIGSCTNGRIEDLRAAAAVLQGRSSRVPGIVSPGSALIKKQAEQEGLDEVFKAAGLEWRASACSMCVGMNGDLVAPGKRCASTTNRNFKGRQGRGARTHLMSPAMVAAAAVMGELTDVRPLLKGRM